VAGIAGCVMPPPRDAPPRPRHPPAYTVAAHMARLQRLGRAHSHEGVTGGYYHTDPEEDGKHDASHSHFLHHFSYLNTTLFTTPEWKRPLELYT
jgi:hypothetical protein